MEVQVLPVPEAERAVLENLAQLYLYDFTEYEDDDVNGQGLFELGYITRYWSEPGRFPFLIRVEGKLAGFALVRDAQEAEGGEVTHHMAEFFVMRKYRRLQVGRSAAWQLFDRFPGRWNVSEVPKNLPAQQFWRKIIGEYTDGAFEEILSPESHGPTQVFQSTGRPPALTVHAGNHFPGRAKRLSARRSMT